MKHFLRFTVSAMIAVVAARSLPAQAPAGSVPSPTPAIQTGGEVAALAAAEVWVGLLDDGRFADSWNSSASIFQKDVPQVKWLGILNDHRPLLGKLLSRKHKNSQFAKTILGAPDGQYVVIQYDSSFENKATAVETVTMTLDKDGLWKACGYFVR